MNSPFLPLPALTRWIIVAAALVGLVLMSGPARTAESPEVPYRTDSVLVAFKPQARAAARVGLLARYGLKADPANASPYFVKLKVGPGVQAAGGGGIKALVAALRRDPAVRVAEPNFIRSIAAIPNDRTFTFLWNLHNSGQTGGTVDADVDAPEAWDVTVGNPRVIAAVIDTGVDYTHEDLKDNILKDAGGRVVGRDFVHDDDDPMDDHNHGTHVAGILGARGANKIGVTGVCQRISILPIKAFNTAGHAETADLVSAFDFAISKGARVINASYGSATYSTIELEAILRARAAGALVCAAAGNDGVDNDIAPHYPANYKTEADNVLAIGATNHFDAMASFSNFGAATVDIAAPGAGVYSTVRKNGYELDSGTSMAAPHVSGAAALVLAKYPSISLENLRRRILASADRPQALTGLTVAGRLNAARALENDTVPPGTPTTFTATHHGETALRLAWTASGDDGPGGAAAQYDLRYATSAITAGNFAQAPAAVRLPAPTASGAGESFLLPGLEPGTAYHFALRAIDNAGNVSPLATLGPVSTLASSVECVFEEDVEGAPRFSGEAPWSVTTEDRYSGSKCYTDSPGSKYKSDTNDSLNLIGTVTPTGPAPLLTFFAKTDLEPRFDNLFVEASTDGKVWHRLMTLTGRSDWAFRTVPLMSFRDRAIRLRFRLLTDGDFSQDGVWLDDIRVCSRDSDLCLFQDNADGAPQLSMQRPWAISTERSFSPPKGYTDSPGRSYGNNLDTSLTQNAAVTLLGLAPQLTFWAQTELEDAYDFLYVEVSDTGGATWERVYSVTGAQPATFYTVSLAPYFAKSVRVRFRLSTDVDTAFNGVWIDDIRICGERLFPLPGVIPPAPPSDLTAEAGSAGIRLQWKDNSANETGFRVERKVGSGAYGEAGLVGAGVRSFTDAAVTPGTQYTYRVRALGHAGESTPSNEAKAGAAGSGRMSVAGKLNFRKVRVRGKKKLTLRIRNLSATESLRVTVNAPSAPYKIASGGGAGVIPPRGTRLVRVVFQPVKRGKAKGQLVIGSSDLALSSATVKLIGTGR